MPHLAWSVLALALSSFAVACSSEDSCGFGMSPHPYDAAPSTYGDFAAFYEVPLSDGAGTAFTYDGNYSARVEIGTDGFRAYRDEGGDPGAPPVVFAWLKYSVPSKAGTYRLEDMEATAYFCDALADNEGSLTLSPESDACIDETGRQLPVRSVKVTGTHTTKDDGAIDLRFCSGDPSFCSDNLLDWSRNPRFFNVWNVTGRYSYSPGGTRQNCY